MDVESVPLDPPPRRAGILKKPWSKPTCKRIVEMEEVSHGLDPAATEVQSNPADGYVAS